MATLKTAAKETTLLDPSTAFSAFDMEQLGKIRRYHWKERLKISIIVKLETDSLKRARFRKVAKIRRHLYGVCPYHTNVCKIEGPHLRYFSTNNF